MPLIRFPTVKGLVYTIDLSKIADRENPRTVEAPISTGYQEPYIIEWGDGTSTVIDANTTYPEHTYDGTENIYRVTVRSVNGALPIIRANRTNGKIGAALVSIDHFNGSASGTLHIVNTNFQNCTNLQYVDPRLCGQWNIGNLASWLQGCTSLAQAIESFCFDFCGSVTTLAGLFNGDYRLLGTIPSGMFDNNTAVTSVRNTFKNCAGLTPPPYEFWNASYAASFTDTTDCYGGCSTAMRAQVPTAYGGTMTVS